MREASHWICGKLSRRLTTFSGVPSKAKVIKENTRFTIQLVVSGHWWKRTTDCRWNENEIFVCHSSLWISIFYDFEFRESESSDSSTKIQLFFANKCQSRRYQGAGLHSFWQKRRLEKVVSSMHGLKLIVRESSPHWLAGWAQLESKVEIIQKWFRFGNPVIITRPDFADIFDESFLYNQSFLQVVVDDIVVQIKGHAWKKVEHGVADCVEAQCHCADYGFSGGQDDGASCLQYLKGIIDVGIGVVDTTEVVDIPLDQVIQTPHFHW